MKWPRPLPPSQWRDKSLAERDRAMQSACRAAMQILEEVPDREARLSHVDPVPESTRALLARLASRKRHAD